MKNLVLSILLLMVFTGASAQQAKLSGLLVEFETAVKWEAVDPNGKTGEWPASTRLKLPTHL